MILYLFSFFIGLMSFTGNVKDILGVKGPLNFNKTEFNLALSGNPEVGMSMHVFMPKNEKLDNYNQKLSLLLINSKKDINDIVKAKIKDLSTRQKKDLNCKFSAIELIDGKEMIVESVISEMNDNNLSEAEFSVSRVIYLGTSNNNNNSVLIYTYSWRTYDAEASEMLNNISSFKNNFIVEMKKIEVPAIHLPK